MERIPNRLSYHIVKEDNLKAFIVRGVKDVNTVQIEKCMGLKCLERVFILLRKILSISKITRKLNLIYGLVQPITSEEVVAKFQYVVYHRFSQMLKYYRGNKNFPLVKHMKNLETFNCFWDRNKAEIPTSLRNLKYFEIIIRKPESSKDIISTLKLRRLPMLKEVKITGGTCSIWRLFTNWKDHLSKKEEPIFHLNFSTIECDTDKFAANIHKLPVINQRSIEILNNKTESLFHHLIPLNNIIKPLDHFGYFDLNEPTSLSLKPQTYKILENYENLRSLSLNFHETNQKKNLEEFFLYLTFPKNLEIFKLTLFLKEFNVSSSFLNNHYVQFAKMSKLKDVYIVANFRPDRSPGFQITDKIWKHFVRILDKIPAKNPLEHLTLALHPNKANLQVYDIGFDQTLGPLLSKFKKLRSLKLSLSMSKLSFISKEDNKINFPFPQIEKLCLNIADFDVKLLKYFKNQNLEIKYLSIDVYSPIQFAKVLDMCRGIQTLKSAITCHFEPHVPTIKDGKDSLYYEQSLVREIQGLYNNLENLQRACFCFPFEEISTSNIESIGNCFAWRKFECTKVETKSWMVLNDVRSRGKYRFCPKNQ